MGKPNLQVFAETLMELARENRDLIVVTGDSRGSAQLGRFCAEFPRQVVEVGIAEQNLVGISVGLSMANKKVYAVSPACFLTSRALEQIKNDVAYSDHPVKLIGISAGVSYGALGSTHHSLHDLAALLAIHNIDIVIPSDNFEAREAITASLTYPKPLYIRFGKKPLPNLPIASQKFEIGKAITLRQGRDVNFVACGETVWRAWKACELLEEKGISSGVVSFHTLRPFDWQALLSLAESSAAIISVEEHNTNGGLGSLCAALMMEAGCWRPFKRVAIPDEHTVTGSQEEVFDYYKISPHGLCEIAVELLERSAKRREYQEDGVYK